MNASRVSIFSKRALYIQLLFILGFLILNFRFVYINFYDDKFLDEQVISRFSSEYPLIAKRGEILDRNNRVLALDVASYSVGIDIAKFKSNPRPLTSLSKLLDIDEDTLARKINRKRRYIEVKRHISEPIKKKIEELNNNAVFFKQNLRRSYPQKQISSHVVGITDIDRQGIQGTELVFDKKLEGKIGKYTGIKYGIQGDRVEAVPGEKVKLTIDIRLQSIAYEELKKSVKETKASSGSAIIVNAKNADILALVNEPTFDPSDRSDIKNLSVFRNRATIDAFEPGSVVKPMAMAAILDSSKVDITSSIQTSPGWIDIGGYKTSDFRDYGTLSLSEIISYSSNVGMVKLCSNQEEGHLVKYFSIFGAAKYPSNILIPSREGFLPNQSELTLRDKVSLCYGYGLTMTALQIAQAYLVFAREGVFKELNLYVDQDIVGLIEEERVLSEKTVRLINMMLIEAVHSKHGTAKKARIDGLIVAGKTGTAEKNDISGKSYTVTFSGFVPAQNPDLLVVVVLHGLKGEKNSGGQIAAPLFSKITSQSLNVLESGS